jgi:hypothetical protein
MQQETKLKNNFIYAVDYQIKSARLVNAAVISYRIHIFQFVGRACYVCVNPVRLAFKFQYILEYLIEKV